MHASPCMLQLHPSQVRAAFKANDPRYMCSWTPRGFGLAAAENGVDREPLCDTDSLLDLINTQEAEPDDADAVAAGNVIQIRLSLPFRGSLAS